MFRFLCVYLICDETDENKFYKSLMSSIFQKYGLDSVYLRNRAGFTCASEWINLPSTRVPESLIKIHNPGDNSSNEEMGKQRVVLPANGNQSWISTAVWQCLLGYDNQRAHRAGQSTGVPRRYCTALNTLPHSFLAVSWELVCWDLQLFRRFRIPHPV